jgi:Tfp pilus assembly protein PilN
LGVEAAVPDGLLLESIQPQMNRSSVMLKVMAKDFPSVMSFVQALANDAEFTGAHLISETQADTTTAHPWRAVIELRWKAASHE